MMLETVHKNYKNVEIWKIYHRIDTVSFYNEIKIELMFRQEKDSTFPSWHGVDFEKSDLNGLLDKIKKMKKCLGGMEGNDKRIYLTNGMEDIDFWKNGKGRYMISHSPSAGVHLMFEMKDGEFDKLERSLKALTTGKRYEDL